MPAISLYLPPESGLKKEEKKKNPVKKKKRRCVPVFCNSVTIVCILPPKSGEKTRAISLQRCNNCTFLRFFFYFFLFFFLREREREKKKKKKMRAIFRQPCNNCLYLTSGIR